MNPPRQRLEQRIIDHEVRVARTRAAVQRVHATREAQRERRQALQEMLWLREQCVAMLRTAATEEELQGLGLTDEVMRELRLGDSVSAAWHRFTRSRLHPSGPGRIG